MQIQANTRTASVSTSYFEHAKSLATSDPESQVAAMMLEHAKESRELNQSQHRAEEAQLRATQGRQLEALREQAANIRKAGWTQGALQIVGGTLTAASAGASADEHTATAGNLKGGAEGTVAAGTLLGKHYEAQATAASANATEAEHQSAEAERRLQDIRDANAELRDLERSALDHLKAVKQTRVSTDAAAASWRA